MILDANGNLFDGPAEGLVNTVNTVGVMGKGIALQFKRRYPENFKVYQAACKAQTLVPGVILDVWDQDAFGKKCILNFPTKRHWRNPSKYEYIEAGLPALREAILRNGLTSVAIPPLGCGNGGLDWGVVRPMIVDALGDLATDVYLFAPQQNFHQTLRKTASESSVKLTPRRAMLLHGLYAYEREGEAVSLLAGNKIVYFLQRLGQDMNLSFQPYIYGPYNPAVTHVMAHFNGSYLRGLEDKSARPFEPLELRYTKPLRQKLEEYSAEQLSERQVRIVNRLRNMLKGYSTALGIELLSSVDYILTDQPDADVDQILAAAGQWNDRKQRLLRRDHVTQVYEKLMELQEVGWLNY